MIAPHTQHERVAGVAHRQPRSASTELGDVADEREPLADAGEGGRDALQVALRKDRLDAGEVRAELRRLLQASA